MKLIFRWETARKLIFISAPYTIGDHALNVRAAIDATEQVMLLGAVAYNPLLSHFHQIVYPPTWHDWMKQSLTILSKCDALLRVDGESEGADKEVVFAKENGIPVFYSLADLKAWLYPELQDD